MLGMEIPEPTKMATRPGSISNPTSPLASRPVTVKSVPINRTDARTSARCLCGGSALHRVRRLIASTPSLVPTTVLLPLALADCRLDCLNQVQAACERFLQLPKQGVHR